MNPDLPAGMMFDEKSPAGTPTPPLIVSAHPSPPLLHHATTPQAIPDHELLHRIGEGSYGEVWLARNAVGTLRAVKIVWRKTFWHDHPFEREFKGMQRFEPVSRTHEGLVDILQIGRGDGYFNYVMELADAAEPRGEDGGSKIENRNNAGTAPCYPQSSILDPQNYVPRTLTTDLARHRRLPVAECVRIGLSLTAALSHLHRNGLVHRDIKPSNIIFVDGVPKLADIGLVAEVSDARSYVGTEGFIPPEGPGTVQADLYSLGKPIYEISTGKDRHAFPELPTDLAEQSEVKQLVELNAILLKACQNEVRDRYHSAGQMHAELALLQHGQSVTRRRVVEGRWSVVRKLGLVAAALALLLAGGWLVFHQFTPTAEVGVRSSIPSAPIEGAAVRQHIAVLPFDNESPDKADEYLGTQMAWELASALSKIPELRVLPQDSATALKGAKDRRATAQQLKLTAVLDGRIRKMGNELRLTAQLIETTDGFTLWSDSYEAGLKDMFGLQTSVAESVAEKLDLKLTDTVRARLAMKTTKDWAAYQLYLVGRDECWDKGSIRRAMECFQSAIRLDTNFALAYSGLADCYLIGAQDSTSPKDSFSNALAMAEKAVMMNNDLAEAHTSLARVKYHLYDWVGAEKEFQAAIGLKSNYANAHNWYSKYLCSQGKFEQAITHAKLAKDLDPLSRRFRNSLGSDILFDARHYDVAQQEFQGTLELNENHATAVGGLGWCYEVKGRYDEKVVQWAKEFRIGSVSPERIAALTQAYREAGLRGYWQKELEQRLEQGKQGWFVDTYWIAADYAAIGENDEAFKWLERAYQDHHSWMPLVALEYRLYSLHSDPRFAALLKKMGLPLPVWKK